MSDIFDRLKSGAGKVAKEAGKVAKGADKAVEIRRIEMQIGGINKEINEEYQNLGQIVYDTGIQSLSENSNIDEIRAKISELKKQIEEKEAEIKTIKEDTSETLPPTGKTFCSNCGSENSTNAKFCSSCGSKIGE